MYSYRTISREELDIIRHLWVKLNEMQYSDSVYFKDHYSSFTFEKRTAKFKACDPDALMVEIAETAGRQAAGYCIATVSPDNTGEIDSIFIDEGHRGNGIGDRLMRDSIAWLRMRGCERIRVSVAHGHESVFPFYRKYGFFPRMTCLEMK
ncbi:MAG TPA: GNAT family N-acetyltransferase [Spirochaetota bacterium]|nr:GNAT family N-acetyltransferase [Spirochaetota bacterium]HRS76483.1 GNAT family N-acetyltransferase [Spirochaetota bacterium]HRT74913.1 GNAT family N-acetyltransferase [Spirochaetota bacterium]